MKKDKPKPSSIPAFVAFILGPAKYNSRWVATQSTGPMGVSNPETAEVGHLPLCTYHSRGVGGWRVDGGSMEARWAGGRWDVAMGSHSHRQSNVAGFWHMMICYPCYTGTHRVAFTSQYHISVPPGKRDRTPVGGRFSPTATSGATNIRSVKRLVSMST